MDRPLPVYNVFEALDVPDAEELAARADLAAKIIGVIQERQLTYADAADAIGCERVRIERICNADLDGFTMDELCRYLVALGQDVQIAVKPAAEADAHLCVLG